MHDVITGQLVTVATERQTWLKQM